MNDENLIAQSRVERDESIDPHSDFDEPPFAGHVNALDYAEMDLPFPIEESLESSHNKEIFRKALLEWIKQKVTEVEKILLQFDSFNFIANLTFSQLTHDPETYLEPNHKGLGTIVEYVALIYLKHPYNIAQQKVLLATAVEDVRARVEHIVFSLQLFYSLEALHEEQDEKAAALSTFRFRSIIQEFFVRSPGYMHHQHQNLRAIFRSQNEWMAKSLGFTIEDLIRVDEGFIELTSQRFHVRCEVAIAEQNKLLAESSAVRDRLQKGEDVSGAEVTSQAIHLLASLSAEEAKQRVTVMMSAWISTFLADSAFAVTSVELANHIGLEVSTVVHVLEYFCMDFGVLPEDWFLMSPIHELKTRPFMRDRGRYLYPVPGTLIWGARERLEESLNPQSGDPINTDMSVWSRYDKLRAEFLERESLRLLQAALPSATIHHKLFYDLVEASETKTAELDGLIIFDRTLFLLEAKAGNFSAPARRGSKDRIRRNFKDIFGNAHAQGLRAKTFIERTPNPVFRLENGKSVTINPKDFSRIILISVTLDSLDAFTTLDYQLYRTGILQSKEFPWFVSLSVLRVICEMNEFQTQLIHYISRRLRVSEMENIEALDELDFFGHYLAKGLYFEEQDESYGQLITSFSVPFDTYYSYEMGHRTETVAKPVQPMPTTYRELIQELEASGFKGYSEAVLLLLEWDEETRENIIYALKHLRNLTEQDRRVHDFSAVSTPPHCGITIFSCTPDDYDATVDRMARYTLLKKYQQHADVWLGILTLVEQSRLIHALVIHDHAWEKNPHMDALMQSMPQFPVDPKSTPRDPDNE